MFTSVYFFKEICESLEEPFVLFELEIENNLLKVLIQKFSLVLHSHQVNDLISG